VGGLLAIPVADTLKRGDGATPPRALSTADRTGLWQAQTPQMFRCGILRAALARPGALAATDEAEAVEALARAGACAPPRLVEGSALNIKVTFAADLALAAAILSLQEAR
jgi:2-C-methyl-D-erythritol 4-phosphate cytidylyltransferase